MRILIKDLVPDTDYIIQARGRNAEGSSPWSGILEIHTLRDITPPSPVENLEFVPSGTSFVATWERPTTSSDGTVLEDFAYYTVHITGNSITRMYRVTQERFDLTFEMNVGAFEGVAASVTISVVAVDQTGNESEAAIATSENPPPGPITGLVGAAAADAIDIRWDATTELDWKHYQVLVGTTTNEASAVHRAYVESNDYSVFSVDYNTDHYIFVRQIDLFGTPGPAAMVGPFRPKNYWLVDTASPTGVSVNSITSAVDPTDPSGGRSQITLSWTGSPDPDLSGYTIRYSTSNVGPWEYVEAPRDATSAVIRRLLPGTTYYVALQAYDYQGNRSAWLNAGSGAPNYPHTTVGDTTAPSQVTGVAVNGGGSNLTITWNAVADADVINNQGHYQIQIDQQNTFNTANLKSMTNSGTVVSFTSLPANTTYYARVRAYDRSGNAGPWSSTVSGGTGTAATPLSDGIAPASSPTPTVISLLGALGVQWTPVGNVDIVTYEVHLSTTSGFTPAAGTKAGEVTGTSFQIRTLPGTTTLLSYGTTYYVKLIAKDRDGSAAAGSQGSGQISKVATQDFSGTARDLGALQVYRQDTAPSGTNYLVNDLWFKTPENISHVWNGSAWVENQDAGIDYAAAQAAIAITNASTAQTTANNAVSAAAAAQADADAALVNAQTAQTTADGKAVTYFQATAPTGLVAGDVGDLWFDTDDGNKMYRWSGSAWVVSQDTAITTAINNAAAANTAAGNAQTTANSKITTYYQAGAPTGGTYTTGDLWVRSADNRLHRWSGSAWTEVVDTSIATAQAAATAAASVADGKVTTFFQTSVPTSISIGDLWIDTDDGNKPYRANAKNVSTIVTNGNGWYAIQDAGITTALTGLAGKITTYYQATMPSETGPVTGDLWIDTDDGNRIYRFNASLGSGSKWVSTQFGGGAIQDASISGVKLVASSVTAEKLTIGTFSPNAVPNYSFEDLQQVTVPGTPAGLPARWSYETVIPSAGATYAVHTGLVRSGARSISMTNAPSAAARIMTADYLSAAAGERWYVAAAVAGPTITSGNAVSLQVHFSNQAGTSTSFTIVTETNINIINAWTRIEGQFTVPSDATQFKVAVGLKSSVSSRTVYVDMVEAFQVTTGTMIKDDSISTGHIVTAGLSASVVKFGEMDGDRIGVNTLNANRMEAGTAFTTDLFVKSVFTLGDAALGAGQIKSFDYSSALGTGFKLTSSGLDIQAGTINARALQIQQGHNMVPAQYAGFEFNPSFYTSSTIVATNATFSASNARYRFETSSLYVTNTSGSTSATVTLSTGLNVYNIPVNPNSPYVASTYVYHENPGATFARIVVRRQGGSHSSGPITEIPYSTWTRLSVPLTTDGTNYGVNVRVDIMTPNTSLWIDGVQFEPLLGGLITPSEWKPPGVTSIHGGIIRTGEIRSNNLTTEGDTTTPMWSIDTQGTAIFGDAMVKGRLVVGETSNANNSTISVRSHNYAPGTTGWSIAGNGAVEFNTGTFRGALAVGAKFSVTTDGTMTATDGVFSGAITAKSGNISGILQVGDGASGEKYLIVGSSNAGNPHFVLDGRTTRSHMAYAYNGSGVTFSVDNSGNSFFGGQITVGATVASGSPIATTTYVNSQDSAVQTNAYNSASSMVVSERTANTTITNKTVTSSTLIAGAYAGAVPRVELSASGDHREIRFYPSSSTSPGYIDYASGLYGGAMAGFLRLKAASTSSWAGAEFSIMPYGLQWTSPGGTTRSVAFTTDLHGHYDGDHTHSSAPYHLHYSFDDWNGTYVFYKGTQATGQAAIQSQSNNGAACGIRYYDSGYGRSSFHKFHSVNGTAQEARAGDDMAFADHKAATHINMSDPSLKQELTPLEEGYLTKAKGMRTFKYDFLPHPDTPARERVGIDARDLPDLVKVPARNSAPGKEDEIVYGVDSAAMDAFLLGALKELAMRLDEVEDAISQKRPIPPRKPDVQKGWEVSAEKKGLNVPLRPKSQRKIRVTGEDD